MTVRVQIKLQFNIQNMLIIMFGVVRTVEYNETSNQSLLHFECIHLDQTMKNEVLSFVYNMLPDREKEVYEALKLTDTDEIEAGDEGLENVTEDQQNDLTNGSNGTEQKSEGQGSSTDNDIPNLPPMPDSVTEGDFPTISD